MTSPEIEKSSEEQENVEQVTAQVLSGFSRERASLIPILQQVQGRLGYLPRGAMTGIAEYLKIPSIDIYGVVTFYNQFRLNPPGRHSVRVCLGTACHMKGGSIALDAWKRRLNINPRETTPDRELDLDTVACVGCCTMAPVTVVDGNPEARVDPTRVDGILLGFGYEPQKKDKEKSESE